MASELAAIRGMIERQLAGFRLGRDEPQHAPGRARLIGDLLEAGFSASLARELAEEVPEDEAPEDAHRLLHEGAGSGRFRCDGRRRRHR
jgi:flagellar biosynthesis protein FlhF